jgi:phage repressor protein C with HTH and peptisase S24 domain
MDDLTRHRKNRLRELIESEPYSGSQAAFAAAAGLSEGRISQLLKPDESFGERSARNIESELRLSERYFESGLAAEPKPEEDGNESSREDRDVVHIPQYEAGGAMGRNLVLQGDQPGIIRHMTVTQEWAQKNLKAHTGLHNLCIVTGFGDSMKPMYNPGDPLILDQGVKSCEIDAVYFFRVDGFGFIKRLQIIPGEGIRVISENKKYEPWTIKRDADFEVFGRVMKAWCSEDL